MTARDPALSASISEELMVMVASGDLRPHVSGRYPLEQAGEALRLLIDRKAVGKVVVTP
jgi:NADPH2:quinone reductase